MGVGRLVGGLLAVGGAYVTGTGARAVWLVGTVDRVTEFPALTGWWIVAMWAVVASGARRRDRRGRPGQSPMAGPGDHPDDPAPLGGHAPGRMTDRWDG